MFPPLDSKERLMAWNGSNGAANLPRRGERRRAAGAEATHRLASSAKGKSPLRGICAALFVIIGAGLAWWLLSRPTNVEPEIDDSAKKSVVQSTPSSKPHRAKEADKPAAPQKTEPTVAIAPEREMTPEEIEAEERRKDPLYDRHHIVAKMPLVKEPIEQLMLTVFETELGDMPPMLPAIPAFDEVRFNKLVNLQTLPEEGDSKEALLSKELVNQVKAELAKYLKEGGTTSGFLAYYVNELDSAFRERETCKEIQMKSMKTDDPEVAREMYFKINERLAAKGIKPLTLTKRQKAHLGIEEE